MVALLQPAQEVAKYKTRLLLEVSCHFGNLEYSTAQSLIHRGEKKEEEGEKEEGAEKEKTFDWLYSTHLWISQAHCWQKFKQSTSNLFFIFSTLSPTTFPMSVATYRSTNSPECITPCISSCPQCRISKVMCCQYFPCPAGASPPQSRGALVLVVPVVLSQIGSCQLSHTCMETAIKAANIEFFWNSRQSGLRQYILPFLQMSVLIAGVTWAD